jgi:hypothetical protein
MTSPSLQTIYYITGIAGVICVALAPSIFKALRWVYRQIRAIEETKDFVLALHENHLPHIEWALKLICEKLEIELTEPPPLPPLHKDSD